MVNPHMRAACRGTMPSWTSWPSHVSHLGLMLACSQERGRGWWLVAHSIRCDDGSAADWDTFVQQSVWTIREDEGNEKAEEVKAELARCYRPYVRVAVLKHQLANLTLFRNSKNGLAPHKDGEWC